MKLNAYAECRYSLRRLCCVAIESIMLSVVMLSVETIVIVLNFILLSVIVRRLYAECR